MLCVGSAAGSVTLMRTLNFEVDPQFVMLNVTVKDSGSPSLTVWQLVNLTVVNVNDAPVLASNATFNVSERTPLGSVVYNLAGFDEDTWDTLSYAIVSGNTNTGGVPAFDLDRNTGQLRAFSHLNFETVGGCCCHLVLLATVTASDGLRCAVHETAGSAELLAEVQPH